jgi:hypothetical protein
MHYSLAVLSEDDRFPAGGIRHQGLNITEGNYFWPKQRAALPYLIFRLRELLEATQISEKDKTEAQNHVPPWISFSVGSNHYRGLHGRDRQVDSPQPPRPRGDKLVGLVAP